MATHTSIGVIQTQRLALSTALQSALRVLRMDAAELVAFLEEQAAEIPALSLRPVLPAVGDWLPRWSAVGLGGMAVVIDGLGQPDPSLSAHVLAALPALVSASTEQRIALALADALEPSGWLGRGLDAIAADLRVPPSEVEQVLCKLQRIEPAGLFARDLAECLRLQAISEGLLNRTMEVMLANLPLVAAGQWERLADLAAVSVEELRVTFADLRGFNPKPGAQFSSLSSPLREPDLIVRRSETGWAVEVNRSSLPALAVDEAEKMAPRAREILGLVESRNSTLLRVGQAILAAQRSALEQGPAALRPLTMQEIAQELGLHRSTVSRVVAGTAVDTPQGTWWLRELFSADMGADVGGAALRARLARLVAQEDKFRPLSDTALAQALSANGSAIARRTVAKYRTALRIAPAYRRKRIAEGS